MALELDTTVDKLERNYQHGYKHIDGTGRHWVALTPYEVVEALDAVIAVQGINDPSVFLLLLYRIVAHQTYHLAVDEKSTLPYHSIEQMLAKGEGNPRIHKLEDVMNAVGASLVICRIEDRDNDIPHDELQRACFFQDQIDKERWPFRNVIDLLFTFRLQLRVFLLDEATERNTLSHRFQFAMVTEDDKPNTEMSKAVSDLLSLLQFFSVATAVQLVISPSNDASNAKMI